jgi:hypothetical protein
MHWPGFVSLHLPHSSWPQESLCGSRCSGIRCLCRAAVSAVRVYSDRKLRCASKSDTEGIAAELHPGVCPVSSLSARVRFHSVQFGDPLAGMPDRENEDGLLVLKYFVVDEVLA